MVAELERLTNGTDAVHVPSPKTDVKEDMDKINSIKSQEKEKDIIVEFSKEISPLIDNVKFIDEDGESERSESPVERVKFQGFDDVDSICSESSSEDDKLPPIPDGGWGWVVVLSAFLVSACADGLAFSFGLLHTEFTEYFQAPQSKTALIGSIFMATPLLAGPIMSALVDRFGCRITTMLAGLTSTIAFLLAAVSNSVEMLCLTFGFLSGLAMGVLYVTAVVSVAFWFDKRRNFAVSLASCGIGFGTLFYSPMMTSWLAEYGWRSTIILLAGTLLNMCVCGAVMRNPEWLKIKQKKERALSRRSSRRSSSMGSVSSRSIGEESVFLSPEELKSLLKSGKSPDYILSTLATTIAEAEQLEATTQMNAELTTRNRIYSAIHLPTFVQRNEKVPTEVIEKLMDNKRLYNIILHNYPEVITRRKSELHLATDPAPVEAAIEPLQMPVAIKAQNKDIKEILNEIRKEGSKEVMNDIKEEINNAEKALKAERKSSKNEITSSQKEINDSKKKEKREAKRMSIAEKNEDGDKVEPNDQKHHHHHHQSPPKPPTTLPGMGVMRTISTVDHHYLKDLPLYRNTMMHRGAMLSIPTRYKLRASSLPDMYRNSEWSIASSVEWTCWDRTLELIKTTFDFRMFTEFHFLLFNLSTVILSIWFIVPYFFLSNYMDEMKIEGAGVMNSIIGISSSIGIVSLGWAGDQPWMNVCKTYAVCLIICGLSIAAYPFFITNYWGLAIISSIFGVSFASSYSFMPAILMELMPVNRFTVAYGLLLLCEGIGHLVGPPLGGLIYDLTGTYDVTFYMGGFWMVVSGLFIVVVAYTNNFRLCGTAPLLKDLEEADKHSDKSSEA